MACRALRSAICHRHGGKLKTFIKSVAVITLFAVATRAIGFIFRIFLSRVLGAEMLGVYQIAMAFFMVFLTLVSSGLPLAISKQVATKHARGVITAGLVISLAASCLVCLLVFAFRNLYGGLFTDARCIAILIALIPSIIAASVYSVIRAVWWGEKKFFLLGITELIEQILRVIVFVIMLALAFLFVDTAQIAALSYTVACFIGAAVVVIIFIRTSRLTREPCAFGVKTLKNTQYKPLLKSAAPITGVRLVASITMPVISILIPLRLIAAGWSQAAAIAAFGVLVGMTLPLLSIPQTVISSLSTALVPELSSAHKKLKDADSSPGQAPYHKYRDVVHKQIQNCLKFTLFINFLLLPVFVSLGEGIGTFLYADRTSGIYLAQFAWAMIPMSLSQITNAILNSLGAETRAMKHYFIGSIVLFAAIWFLPPVIGISALVVGLGACMSIASLLNLMLITKLTKSPVATECTSCNFAASVISQCFLFTVVSVPAVLAGIFCHGVVQHMFPLFIALGISGIIAMGVFLVLCHLFKIVTIKNLRATLSST